MKRFALLLVAGVASAAFLSFSSHRALADDETGDTEIKIQAPLDAVDCTANTISVLGLTIDISRAAIDVGGGDGENEDGDQNGDDEDGQGVSGNDDQGNDDQGDDDGGPDGATGCAALVTGQSVDVKLASDSTPLVATEVSQGDGENAIEIKAPIQAVDASAQTITVLGLVVDVSDANMGGSDDDAEDGNSEPIDLSQLMPGQFVEMRLASSQPPLSAVELEVRNFANQVDVEVDDADGQEIDDEVDDVEVDVDQTIVVSAPASGAQGPATKHVKKVLHLHTSSRGSVRLAGLATGHAKISIIRRSNGTTALGRKRIKVQPNIRTHVRLRLRHGH